MNKAGTQQADKREALQALLKQTPLLWRGNSQTQGQARGAHAQAHFVTTGFAQLDAALPGGGWPLGGLIELVVNEWGQGELSVLLPLMVALSQGQQAIVLIAPPHIPYAPALQAADVDLQHLWVIDQCDKRQDAAWAAEKALAGAQVGLVLMWLKPEGVKQIRRLQVAAHIGGTLGVLMRRTKAMPSPVSLRLGLAYQADGLRVEVLKSRQAIKRGQDQAVLLPHGF